MHIQQLLAELGRHEFDTIMDHITEGWKVDIDTEINRRVLRIKELEAQVEQLKGK